MPDSGEQQGNSAVARYLALEASLLKWRELHPEDTPEEDAILDEMDSVWWQFSDGERALLESRGAGGSSS